MGGGGKGCDEKELPGHDVHFAAMSAAVWRIELAYLLEC